MRKRIRFFFYEVTLTFMFIFLLSTIEYIILSLFIERSSVIYDIIFYLFRAVIVFFSIPFVLSLMKRLSSKVPIQSEVSIFQSHIKLYRITKSNLKYQVLYGIMLLFLILIPLNFFIFLLMPEMVIYQAFTLDINILTIENIYVFIILLIILQIFISITEETIFRGFIAKRGADNFNQNSAAFISSFFYAFTNFLFFIEPSSSGLPLWFPFIWFTASFIIGIILSLTILRRKWLFPLICANFINKVIMINFLWNYIHGVEYRVIILYYYLPILLISLIIFIWQFKRIKESILIGIRMIKPYFKTEKSKGDLIFQIIFDFFIGIMIFVVSFLITI